MRAAAHSGKKVAMMAQFDVVTATVMHAHATKGRSRAVRPLVDPGHEQRMVFSRSLGAHGQIQPIRSRPHKPTHMCVCTNKTSKKLRRVARGAVERE